MAAPKDGDGYLRTLRPPVKQIAAALRDLIRGSAPELEEGIKYSSPHYDVRGTTGTVVYLAAHTSHVNLGFYQGARLKDPKKILGGTGKGLRHVKVHSVGEAGNPALKELIREAVRLRSAAGPPKRLR